MCIKTVGADLVCERIAFNFKTLATLHLAEEIKQVTV